jgi:hypothetical protein
LELLGDEVPVLWAILRNKLAELLILSRSPVTSRTQLGFMHTAAVDGMKMIFAVASSYRTTTGTRQ